MRIGRSRSSKVVVFGTNRKGVCDFLLVISSHLAPFLRCCDLLAENCEFFLPHSHLTPSLEVNPQPFRISGWNLPAKTRRMGLLYGENRMILTSAVFAWITRVTDGLTDRQTDGIAIAYARLAYMLSRANTVVLIVSDVENCKSQRAVLSRVHFLSYHYKLCCAEIVLSYIKSDQDCNFPSRDRSQTKTFVSRPHPWPCIR